MIIPFAYLWGIVALAVAVVAIVVVLVVKAIRK